MTPRSGPPRGFSLVELLVALLVSAVVVAGAVALMLASQSNFRTTASSRALQETARVALGQVVNSLRGAGYGVDPMLAFDLGPMANVRVDRAFNGGTFSSKAAPNAGGACAGLCRDSTTAPDEIVFFSRDPLFGPHPLTAAVTSGSTSLTVAAGMGGPTPPQSLLSLQRGQILQLVCYTGNMTWAYVEVSDKVQDNGNGTVRIPIAAAATAKFATQNAWLDDPCFGTVATIAGGVPPQASLQTAVEVFKVDRYRYFIQTYDSAGIVQPWGTAGARPYLMLDQGLRDGGGNALVSPVAPNVEDLQFAYVFPYDTTTPLVGATPGTPLSNDDSGVNLAPASGGPVYSDDVAAATRQNHNPGNIGAVRVFVVVRSADQDTTQPNLSVIPAAGNRAQVNNGPAGYVRLLVDTTISVRNLSMLAPYFPSYEAGPAVPGSRQSNVGGG
jgi:prepilin-type N-terminal cleavage/methylation domain-containing protein